jgi:hypothetical protein
MKTNLKAGQRVGLLKLIRLGMSDKKRATWLCICKCGVEKAIRADALACGDTKSCGCKSKHGHRKQGNGKPSPTYFSWSNMLYRCNNPNADNFKWYGGRGITVCRRWSSFVNFLKDLGPRPSGTTLDRINPHGNYTLKNCRWATAEVQANNRQANKRKPMGQKVKASVEVVAA